MTTIGYGWKRTESDLRAAGAEVVYIDEKRGRPERNAMFEHAALRPGDEVLLLSYLDLGGNKLASDRLVAEIEKRGATVRVRDGDDSPPAGTGRPRKFLPDEWQDEDLRQVWLSPIYSQAYKLEQAKRIMGYEVPAHQLYYRYGSMRAPKDS